MKLKRIIYDEGTRGLQQGAWVSSGSVLVRSLTTKSEQQQFLLISHQSAFLKGDLVALAAPNPSKGGGWYYVLLLLLLPEHLRLLLWWCWGKRWRRKRRKALILHNGQWWIHLQRSAIHITHKMHARRQCRIFAGLRSVTNLFSWIRGKCFHYQKE